MAKNILVCDDAAFMRMMIKDILTKNGYNVAGEAENGAKAVEKYNELHHFYICPVCPSLLEICNPSGCCPCNEQHK